MGHSTSLKGREESKSPAEGAVSFQLSPDHSLMGGWRPREHTDRAAEGKVLEA